MTYRRSVKHASALQLRLQVFMNPGVQFHHCKNQIVILAKYLSTDERNHALVCYVILVTCMKKGSCKLPELV